MEHFALNREGWAKVQKKALADTQLKFDRPESSIPELKGTLAVTAEG